MNGPRMREAVTSGPLSGAMRVPGSKSLTNRALICAALAKGTSRLLDPSDSNDTALLANGLNQLGVLARRTEGALEVEGGGGRLHAPKLPIPAGNAGTTLRFLLSLAAIASGTTRIVVGERMAERPNDELLEALTRLGVPARRSSAQAGFEVTGARIPGGAWEVRSDRSSQFLSSLLLVAPYAEAPVTLRPSAALTSEFYVQLTRDVMEAFGVEVRGGPEEGISVEAPRVYRSAVYAVEADASGATYPFAAAAIAGGEVLVPGASAASHQPDAAFPRLLERMGCRAEMRGGGTLVARGGTLRGIDVDMSSMPDAVPALIATALFAQGETRVRGVGTLRFKESNRLEGLAGEIRKLGGEIEVGADSLVVRPRPLHGGLLDPLDDHRLAMSFALIGLRVQGVEIRNPECVNKSFPSFWEELEGLVANSRGTGR